MIDFKSVKDRKSFAAFIHAYDDLSDIEKMMVKADMRENLAKIKDKETLMPRQVEKTFIEKKKRRLRRR